MSRSLNHLRRHVLGAATKAVSNFPTFQTELGQTEISDLDMSIVVDQQILGLEVSVNDVLLVEVHQSVQDLDKVESSIFLIHPFDCFEVVEEFSSGAI